MAQITLKQPGQPVADFAVSGAVITVAGVTVDAVERQLDTSVLVEIRTADGGAIEGGDGAYLAQIMIPARRYDEMPGETEEDPVEIVPAPLDPNAIEIVLWPTA